MPSDNPSIDRRDFLKGTATAGLATAVAAQAANDVRSEDRLPMP